MRRKHGKALAEVLLESHATLCKKRHKNNKPCRMLLFKFNPDKKEQHISEETDKCVSNMLMLLKRHHIKSIKAMVTQMSEVYFTKENIKLNHSLPVVIEEFNLCTNLHLDL